MNLRTMLERDEGRRYIGYLDTEGVPTIGVGHTGPEVYVGLIWTDDQVNTALDGDIAEATAGCTDHFSPWFQLLNEPRQAVLEAMVFQLGIGFPPKTNAEHPDGKGVRAFVNTLAAVRDQHFDLAADGMRASKWARQTPKRVMRMAVQIANGTWQ